MDLVIAAEPPTRDDIASLLTDHLAFARRTSPSCHVHALDLEGLATPDITFFTARRMGALLGVGALKELGDAHGELKSMHTLAAARGQGVGRRMVEHIRSVASSRGYHRLSLETGTQDEFEPARRLYAALGFQRCPPFGDYTENPYSTCMSTELTVAAAADRRR